MKQFNPFSAFFQTVRLALAGRIRLPRTRIGQEIELDGARWTIFREAIVSPTQNQPEVPGAVFIPRFHLASMPVNANKLFSWLPAWFILGLPGFRSKLWLVNEETGDFAGYYEWDLVENAEAYRNSFAAQFMTRRSVPGSVSFRIIPRS